MTGRCAACGLPGHRYGRNEGPDRFDPQACINELRDRLRGFQQTDLYQAGWDAAIAAAAEAWELRRHAIL